MLKKMRASTCVMIIILIACALFNTYHEATLGKDTPGTSLISKESKQWILDEFGQYETFDNLLYGMANFALDNFKYQIFLEAPQHFNFDEFLTNGYRGCCYDFSIWAKMVVLTWAKHNNVDVTAYVFDVKHLKYENFSHSYNHFIVNGVQYHADFTYLLNIEKYNLSIATYIFKTNCDYKEVAKNFEYVIFGIH